MNVEKLLIFTLRDKERITDNNMLLIGVIEFIINFF